MHSFSPPCLCSHLDFFFPCDGLCFAPIPLLSGPAIFFNPSFPPSAPFGSVLSERGVLASAGSPFFPHVYPRLFLVLGKLLLVTPAPDVPKFFDAPLCDSFTGCPSILNFCERFQLSPLPLNASPRCNWTVLPRSSHRLPLWPRVPL